MLNPFKDNDMKQFFSTLSPFVQESIIQSGLKFDNLSQLQSFTSNLNK